MATPFTATTVTADFGAETAINSNFTGVESAFTTVLSRTDSSANSMEVDLDMNGNDILNANSLSIQATQYTVATLPAASANTGAILLVTDASAVAYSDGSNWIPFSVGTAIA